MWHAITRLLNEQLGAGEISQRTELPGGEIHAAWRIDWAGRAIFVKCDDSTLLPCFTAEADQLNLLARSKTVTVPEVLGVGSDREYSFLLLEYLPPKPLDAHNAFLLGQQLARLHQWSEQPQYGLDYDNHLSTTPQPNAWQRRWASFFAEQRIGWQLELAAEKGMEFGDIDRIVDAVHQQLVSHQPAPSLLHGDLWSGNCALGRTGPIFSTRPATGAIANAIWRCCRCTRNSRRRFMTAISRCYRCPPAFLSASRFINSIPC
ncbi:Fructosamine-3-kinase [Cronobacter sakazakii]|nr:Fructosamine-3-kinase [Cronobacter sakazakii]